MTSNIQTQLNGKAASSHSHTEYVEKMPYEYIKNINFGSTGMLYVGKFRIYDSQVTVDITSTTNKTYSGKLVVATQNYIVQQATVYGDAANTIAPNIFIKPSTTSDTYIDIYFKPTSWSKNIIHIFTANALGAENICQSVTAIPSNATLIPTNALTANFVLNSNVTLATDAQIQALFA